MRVGILDILTLSTGGLAEIPSHFLLTKQYASITPQAISVWCRQLGHETFYATYYGLGDPSRCLPKDLDVVFISCYTQVSALAYALGKVYRKAGVRTVIGGPHAKAFPVDCLRFFDLVVEECDKDLISDILTGQFDPGEVIASSKPFNDMPLVEERMPEIRATAFIRRKWRYFMTITPMLASVGCPYTCDFCIDWDNPYRTLPNDRLKEDLRYLAKHIPGSFIAFHDPNFGIKFDEVMGVLESLPPDQRPPYIMESSLSILRSDRIKRLQDTNCVFVAPGIESWTDYSNKAGGKRIDGNHKVEEVVEHFRELHDHIPYMQANFIFGLDTDVGDEPIELTKRFMEQTPYVWPTINIPVPFGGTPLFDEQKANNRILKTMPFSFYYAPYLVTTLKNYDPIDYYEKLIDVFSHCASRQMLKSRMKCSPNRTVKILHWARTAFTRSYLIKDFRRILKMLRSDPQFLAFHEGKSAELPQFYHTQYERMLGRYAELLSREDRSPVLEQVQPKVRETTVVPPPKLVDLALAKNTISVAERSPFCPKSSKYATF